jgi:hypothetical protein
VDVQALTAGEGSLKIGLGKLTISPQVVTQATHEMLVLDQEQYTWCVYMVTLASSESSKEEFRSDLIKFMTYQESLYELAQYLSADDSVEVTKTLAAASTNNLTTGPVVTEQIQILTDARAAVVGQASPSPTSSPTPKPAASASITPTPSASASPNATRESSGASTTDSPNHQRSTNEPSPTTSSTP